MKFASFLIVSIFTWISWISVKSIPTQKGLAAEKVYTAGDLAEMLNNGSESSSRPQTQNYNETLTIKDKDGNKGEEKVPNKRENNKKNYQKNRERVLECKRKYREQNKEKLNEKHRNYYKRNRSERIQYNKTYYQKNRETVRENQKIYKQNNKEKVNEYKRKYRQKKKNIQSDNNEGTSLVNPQSDNFSNKGKLPIVCGEEGNLFNQEEEECNKGVNEQNQIEVEEPNKILEDNTNQKELNKKIYSFDLNERPFDLNEKPDDEELENY